ncbi:hypothetical protein VTN02DRAFT_6221 [Thermoascus thermophilus]
MQEPLDRWTAPSPVQSVTFCRRTELRRNRRTTLYTLSVCRRPQHTMCKHILNAQVSIRSPCCTYPYPSSLLPPPLWQPQDPIY